jgi:hypothetical protein
MKEDSNLERIITSRQEESVKKKRVLIKKYATFFLIGFVLSFLFSLIAGNFILLFLFVIISLIVFSIYTNIEWMG